MGRLLTGPDIFEHRVTAYLEDFFRGLGVPFERQPVAPLRDNIVARFEPPGARRTILWEVHQDTVPTDDMTVDPFEARVEDGRLLRPRCLRHQGRHGGDAGGLRPAGAREAGRSLPTFIMACTVDEEYTFLGVQRLVQGLQADFAVVAEPTQLHIVHAHKGVVRWHVDDASAGPATARGPEQGVNAIYRMGRLLAAIERYAERLPAIAPDPLLGPPTLSVGRIEGGTSVNTVPDRCRIEVDRRLLPGEDPPGPRRAGSLPQGRPGLDFPIEIDRRWMFCPACPPWHRGPPS